MSFLSGLSHPSLFVASIGGVSLGVTLLLLPWKSETSGNSSSSQFLVTQSEGNCTIVDFLKTFRRIFPRENRKDYYYISCNSPKRIKEEWDSIIPNRWEGAFPKSIFKEKIWNKRQKLKVVLKEFNDISYSVRGTYEEEWPYRVTFSFEQFEDLAGEWKYLEDDGVFVPPSKTATVVRLTESKWNDKNIYILWDSSLNRV